MSWGHETHDDHEESFWPSFSDIMMVVTMVFLLITLTVVLSNTRLVTQLRTSIKAEQQASQLAEEQLKTNATLEEQVEYFKNRAASVEYELLRSRAKSETLNQELDNARQALQNAQTSAQAGQTQLAAVAQRTQTLEQELSAALTASKDLQTQLEQRQARTTELEAEVQRLTGETETLKSNSTAALSKLQGELDELDQKYQKLLRPARSPKNKQVVEVVYQKGGYQVRKPGEFAYRSVDSATLNSELSTLKEQYKTDLYVKIIIPESSGLSYNEAWRFTRDMLNKYDYYYQDAPAVESVAP
jgi:chromosome segregation ATPase